MLNPMTTPSDGRPDEFRASLSGGGVRATLFAFGALLYLVDSGDHTRVAAISSVSGGSIANAVLAVAGDYSQGADAEKIRSHIGRAAAMLATKGVFFIRGVTSWFRTIAFLALAAGSTVLLLPALILMIYGQPEEIPAAYGETWLLLLAAALVLVVYFLLYAFFLMWLPRRNSQIEAYVEAMAYARVADVKWHSRAHRKAIREVRKLKLSDLETSSIAHVFCATDLVSAKPVFMTRDHIENSRYGKGPADLGVAQAIYASAAFPAVFPPLSVSTSGWHGEGLNALRAPRLFLSDGGVFNNLGTDWFDATRQLEIATRRADAPAPRGVRVTGSFVVNASKPSTVVKHAGRLGYHIPALVRAMTVVQENTVSPRLRPLQQEPHTAVIDIAQSPAVLLRALEGHAELAVRERATTLAAWLLTPARIEHWNSLAEATALVPTQLEAVGIKRAGYLLRHGYMNAAIAAHCVFASPFTPQDLDRDEQWFSDLLGKGV